MPAMKLRLAVPGALVDIGRIERPGRHHRQRRGDDRCADDLPPDLLDAAESERRSRSSPRPRTWSATRRCGRAARIGGSLAHSDPAADFTAVMLALGGSVTAVGSGGERTIAVDDLFVDLLTTSLEADEIITAISIPARCRRRGHGLREARPSGLRLRGGRRRGRTAHGERHVRIRPRGGHRGDQQGDPGDGSRAGADRTRRRTPTSLARRPTRRPTAWRSNGDVYASADYRGHLVRVLTKRALTRAAGL